MTEACVQEREIERERKRDREGERERKRGRERERARERERERERERGRYEREDDRGVSHQNPKRLPRTESRISLIAYHSHYQTCGSAQARALSPSLSLYQ